MRIIIVSLLILFLGTSLYAQNNDKRLTPYQSLSYFLNNLTDDNYYPDSASRVFYPDYVSADKASSYSVKLKQIIDGKGIFVDLEKVPNNPDFKDSVSNKYQYQIHKNYPLIYLERIQGKWYFSKTTSERIVELHKETFPFGTDRLLNMHPYAGDSKILGIKMWQYIGILIIIIFSFISHKVIKSIFSVTLTRIGKKTESRKETIVRIKPVTGPASNVLVFAFIKLLIPILQLPITLSYYLNLTAAALVPLFVMITMYRFVDVLDIYFTRLSLKTESTLDDQLVPVVRKALKAFVVIIGVLLILQNLEVDILPIIAGLSVGGLAVALAAQDTIKNLFGSLMIFIDKPFQIGHWITSGDIDGTVEEVGIRSTRIRTFRNSVMYVPNGKLADTMIDNHGLRVYRRFSTQISVTYDTPADLIELFVEGLKTIVREHPQTRKDYFEIHLNDMASSSLNVMFYIFFEVPGWSDELKCRHEILLSIIRLSEEIGINFAFPTQTIHIENLPGQLSNSPIYKPAQELKPKMEAFLASYKSK